MTKSNLILPRQNSTTGCSSKSYPGHTYIHTCNATASKGHLTLPYLPPKIQNATGFQANAEKVDRGNDF